jgi:hypothetical protein
MATGSGPELQEQYTQRIERMEAELRRRQRKKLCEMRRQAIEYRGNMSEKDREV